MDTVKRRKAGFTLTEVMVSSAIGLLIVAAALGVLWMTLTQWRRTDLFLRVAADTTEVMQRLVYGSEGSGGLRESDGATIVPGTNGWTLTYVDADMRTNVYRYTTSARTIVYVPRSIVVCSNVVLATATTNALNGGVTLRVVVTVREGRYSASNDVTTFVQLRNRWD
jgi:prepilin-type N-terminal cleavage/methylation domain-containing protein